MSLQKEMLDWQKICSFEYNSTASFLTPFEKEVLRHIRNSTYWAKEAIVRFREALMPTQDHNYKYCMDRFKYDIAIVDIIIDSPTILRYVQTVKVTLTDKLANLGMPFLKQIQITI